MLDVLFAVEAVLPELLRDEQAWTGVYADAEKPFLRRLWRQWGDHRVYLHSFEPCTAEEAFAHPHPWKFAVRVLTGPYEMTVGASADPSVPPPSAATMVFSDGSVYEMCLKEGFHAVRPIGRPSYSLMVAAPVIWEENRVRGNGIARSLTLAERRDLFGFFRGRYGS